MLEKPQTDPTILIAKMVEPSTKPIEHTVAVDFIGQALGRPTAPDDLDGVGTLSSLLAEAGVGSTFDPLYLGHSEAMPRYCVLFAISAEPARNPSGRYTNLRRILRTALAFDVMDGRAYDYSIPQMRSVVDDAQALTADERSRLHADLEILTPPPMRTWRGHPREGARPEAVQRMKPLAKWSTTCPPPVPGAQRPPIAIDRDALGTVRCDTRRATAILAEIFADEDGFDVLVPSVNTDHRHFTLVNELRSRTVWSRREFEAAARAHGLMPRAAILALNEWAIDEADCAILMDRGEFIEVDVTAIVEHEIEFPSAALESR